MRSIAQLSMLFVVLPFLIAGSSQTQEASTKAAQASAATWLALIDNQRYAASWDAAASLFKHAVAQEKWEATAQAARARLGPMRSRALRSATFATTLPGAPDGEYVVFQFSGTFARKAAAVEIVTTVLEDDGTWRVGGYFIK